MEAWGLDSDTKELMVESSGNGGSEPLRQGGSKRQKDPRDNFGGRGGRKRGINMKGKASETQQVIHQSS